LRKASKCLANCQSAYWTEKPAWQGNISVRRLKARGGARVLQQPLPSNNYTAVIQIEDRDGGSDDYNLEIDW